MLWCLRVMILVVPLGLAAALLWVIETGRQLEFRTDDALVFATSEEVGALSPLASSRGVVRQIETMVFDRLFRRDDELVVRGSLAESWGYRQRVSVFFADEKAAEKAEQQVGFRIAAERKKRAVDKFEGVSRNGASLIVSFTSYDEGNVKEVMGFIADLNQLPVVKIRLSVKDAVRESWSNFKKSSAEKAQIKREWIEGNQAVVMFVAGDVDQFLKELRLYYESNRNLDPTIELIDQMPCLDVAEWVMTLRDGVSWHDGRAFTSRDVLFSFEEMMRPAAVSPVRNEFSHVASVRDLDSQRILVECREFYAPIAESWERLPLLPSHLLAGKSVADWESFFWRPVGTGSFSIEYRHKNGELVLKRNSGYFRGAPQQERVKFRRVNSHDDRSRLMRTGGVDGFWPTKMEHRLMKGEVRVQLLDDSYRRQTFVAWNLRNPLFQKMEVRQALAHFIDVPAMILAGEDEGVRLCRGVFFPGAWFCKAKMELPKFDPGMGLTLLEQAGWRFDEGAWKNSDGLTLAFKLLLDRDSPDHINMARLLTEQWQAHGISVEILSMTWADLVTEHLHQRDFDAALVSWEFGFGRDQYRVWHSSEVKPGGGNFFGLRNRSIDQVLEALRKETEVEKIRILAASLQKKIQYLQPCLFLYEEADSITLRKGAIRLSRPDSDGGWGDENPTTSPAGLHNEWLWWSSAKRKKESAGSKL